MDNINKSVFLVAAVFLAAAPLCDAGERGRWTGTGDDRNAAATHMHHSDIQDGLTKVGIFKKSCLLVTTLEPSSFQVLEFSERAYGLALQSVTTTTVATTETTTAIPPPPSSSSGYSRTPTRSTENRTVVIANNSSCSSSSSNNNNKNNNNSNSVVGLIFAATLFSVIERLLFKRVRCLFALVQLP